MKSQYKLFFIIIFVTFSTLLFSIDDLINKNTLTDTKNYSLKPEMIEPFCNSINYYKYKSLDYSDIEVLSIKILDSNSWYINLIKAGVDNSQFIKNEYKSKYKANVELKLSDIKCTFDAEVRVHGDWLDHLDLNNLISSMDVKLLNGNIFGITKFKLFLPTTREYDNEIFITTLLSELDFIAPRSAYVNVNVNNYYEGLFIFQEKASKELIENNFFREGPIIEINEKYWWETESGDPTSEGDKEVMIFGRVQNEYWAKRSIQNQYITQKAIELFNKGMFNSYDFDRQLNYELMNSNPMILFEFDVAILATRSVHAMTNHNRILYYDNISENFIPIYYDGFSTFLQQNNSVPLAFNYKIKPELIEAANNLLLKNKINSLDFQEKLKSRNLYMDLNLIENNLEKFYLNLDTILNFSPEKILNINYLKNLELIAIQKEANFYFFNPINEKYFECKIEKTFLCQLAPYNDSLYKEENFLGLSLESLENPKFNYQTEDIKSLAFGNNELIAINNPKIEINNSLNKIEIKFSDKDQKILIRDQVFENYWSFEITSDLQDQANEYIQDFNSLTGCITFYNSYLLVNIIKFNGSFCEDAVNIVRSKGIFNEIKILNSQFDGIDFDFSEIHISNVYVNKSGNDCIDFSSGKYNLVNLDLAYCYDKGVSVGEKSLVNIKKLNVNNSKIAAAVKDSSELFVSEFNGMGNIICFELYRKKQEFGPSFMKIENLDCYSNNNFIQESSIYVSP